MERFSPLLGLVLVLCAGLAVAGAGFFYDVIFASIPYQDPTPELQARYDFHSAVAGVIELCGLGICVAAVPVWLLLRLRSPSR